MKTLRDLQVGDEVIVSAPYSRDGVAQVTKITKSHIYTDVPAIKYNIDDGYEAGVGYRCAHNIRVGSAEEIQTVKNDARRICLSHYLSKFDWYKCDLVFLEGILKLMKVMAIEEKFEPQVGERFNFHYRLNVVTVMTVEGMCRDCDLFETALCGSCNLLCLPHERSDKKHVAFKRIVEWKEK